MVNNTKPAQGHKHADRVPSGDAVAQRARARPRARPARRDYTARSGTWVNPSNPLAVCNQASPQPKPASPAGRNLVPRSGQTRQAAALGWARTRGCTFGCGLAAVPGGRVRASLGRRPHQWYPRVVYSERCRAQENQIVIFRQRPSMYLRVGTRGVGSGLG